jgi:cell division protein FtsL
VDVLLLIIITAAVALIPLAARRRLLVNRDDRPRHDAAAAVARGIGDEEGSEAEAVTVTGTARQSLRGHRSDRCIWLGRSISARAPG